MSATPKPPAGYASWLDAMLTPYEGDADGARHARSELAALRARCAAVDTMIGALFRALDSAPRRAAERAVDECVRIAREANMPSVQIEASKSAIVDTAVKEDA